MTTFARKVYDMDRGIVFDRTQETHGVGLFDVDFRSPMAPNYRAREWTYGASLKARTLQAAIPGAKRFGDSIRRQAHGRRVDIRIVNGLSGEVLWEGE